MMLLFHYVIFLLIKFTTQSPFTIPLKEHGDINRLIPEYIESKKNRAFHNSTPKAHTNVPYINLDHTDSSCDIDFKLRWSTAVGSPVYAPPVIFPVGKDGKKGIFVNTFYQFIEVLGYDGFKPWGWPIRYYT